LFAAFDFDFISGVAGAVARRQEEHGRIEKIQIKCGGQECPPHAFLEDLLPEG
jgi:hypothetical protein